MLVLSSPSGAGKSTIARNLLESDPELRALGQRDDAAAPRQRDRGRPLSFRVACASSSGCAIPTRCSNGRRCTAISTARRASRSRRRWPKAATCCSTSTGRAPSSSRRRCAADIVSIFILPPSMTELKARLKRRAEDQEEVIETRLTNARTEIEHWTRIRLSSSSTTISTAPSPRCSAIVTGRAAAPRPPPGPVRLRLRLAGREGVAHCSPSRQVSQLSTAFASLHEFLDAQRLGPPRAVDAGRFEQRSRRQGSSGSAAASCGAGRRRPR